MTAVAAPPVSPYRGLAAFADTELDALFFFGRERERDVLVANLLASRLTVLYGESGVGKSSLLAAAVVRELRAVAPDAAVVLRDTWSGPVGDAFADVREAAEGYLILDQFEEYFLYHGDADDEGSLLHDLPELLRDTRVNVLIALREDSLARLDAFKARIPSVFANQVRLEHLDRTAARAAILGPVRRWNELAGESVDVEPELVDGVLDEVAVEGRSSDRDRIEAPYLQLVLERIWEAERAAGSSVLRVRTLQTLGGAGTIVREHLHGALAALEPAEQDVAASVFEHLVTPSGTKIAHRAPDLAQYAGVPEPALRRVLTALTHDRIVHSVDGSDRFEIFHDVLAEPIRAWRQQRRLERERAVARRRHRRLVALSALSLCALAIVGSLAGWALSERGTAQAQARHARARELAAMALQQLLANPNRGVALALAAARLEPGAATENVLRQALIADRLRLVRHTGAPVRALAVSPRGDLVAVALAGRRVLLLAASNRRLVREISTPRLVAALSFAAGGRELVTASPVGLASLWDVRTGRALPLSRREAAARAPDGTLRLVPLAHELARELPHVRRLAVTADGSRIAASVATPEDVVHAHLFDGSGRLLRALSQRGITDLAFSPDGRLLAVATAAGFTELRDARSGDFRRTLVDAKSGVGVVAFSPDGKQLATGSADSGVRIWDVATGERTSMLFGHTNPVTSLAWSPNGAVVASGSADRTVLLWRMRGLAGVGSLAATLSGNGGAVRVLAFSPDGSRLVTGSDDRAVRFWDARPDQQLRLLGRGPGPAVGARWSGTEVVGLWPRVVKEYDARTLAPRRVLDAPPGMRFTALGVDGMIAAGAASGAVLVWDGGERLPVFRGRAPVTAVDVSARGLVASGDRAGVVRLWSTRTRGLRWSAQVDGPVASLAFSPGGDRLVAAGPRGSVVWSTGSPRPLQVLRSPRGDATAVFSSDGRLVATAGADDDARLWFAGTGRLYRLLRGHTKPVTGVSFSADGRLLATSSKDADVRVWSVARGTGHVLQRGAFGAISAVAVDDTGRWVAGAAPISVILWSASTGRQLYYLRGHTQRPTGVAFEPHGPTVLSWSLDGTLRLYTCDVCYDLPALVHAAEVRLAQTG